MMQRTPSSSADGQTTANGTRREAEKGREGWLPSVELRFARTSDILFGLILLVLAVFILVHLCAAVSRWARRLRSRRMMLYAGVWAVNLYFRLHETGRSAWQTAQRLPIPWYPIAALTVVPLAVDIPAGPACVWYLVGYCAANAWLLASHARPDGGGTPPPVAAERKDPLAPSKLSSAVPPLFAGMRITIQS